MEEDTIKNLNIEAGDCKKNALSTADTNEQSTKDVRIHAVSDPNTKDVDERTECTFQCQEGYFDKDIGDKIPFKCVPNSDRKSPTGTKKPAPTECEGT